MSISLNCPCGARFCVEDTFAGQTVTCPECQAALVTPALDRTPIRTSGLALASVILALVGAFTVIFTLLAVLLGICALLSVGRNRDRVAGSGYATFGIVAGTALTILSLFLYSNIELLPFDGYLEGSFYSGMVDYSGEREITRKDEGFAITRPSAKWGIAKKAMQDQLGVTCDLMLANPHGRAYVQINMEPVFGRQLDAYVDELIRSYRNENREVRVGILRPTMGGFKLRERRPVKAIANTQVVELVFDLHLGGEELTYLDHIVLAANHDEFYMVQGWTARRRFARMEDELRRALDSFRVLP